MRKLLISLFLLLPGSLILVSCTTKQPAGRSGSGLKYRAFVSDSVSAGSSSAGVYIVDAEKDFRPFLGPIGAGNTPGMMVVTPNRVLTLVFSGNNLRTSDNTLNLIDNATESGVGRLTLPDYTESFVVSPDSATAYVAVPNAPVVGQSPGIIDVVSIGTNGGAITGQVNIPSVHHLALNNSGNRLLAFSDVLSALSAPCADLTPSFVFVVTPSNVNIDPCPIVPVHSFDHPVQAFFNSGDTTAYLVNCGAECGGTQASVQTLDMTTSPPTPGPAVGVCTSAGSTQCAASIATVDGSTMYLAGSYLNPSATDPCPTQTAFTPTCGLLTVLDLNTMTPLVSGISITDGFHSHIALGANGQLFVGARTCTETTGVSGCLSIYNSSGKALGKVPPGGVLVPPANGDVTGIEAVAKRTVVYAVQGATVTVYDTTTDDLAIIKTNPNNPGHINNLVGNFVDVKVVDF